MSQMGDEVATLRAENEALRGRLDEAEKASKRWERWATAAANDFDRMADVVGECPRCTAGVEAASAARIVRESA